MSKFQDHFYNVNAKLFSFSDLISNHTSLHVRNEFNGCFIKQNTIELTILNHKIICQSDPLDPMKFKN